MPLCFIADENIETEIVDALRELGHDTIHVAHTMPGAEDEEILLYAYDRGCILITNDKDFGELVFRQKKTTAGVILLRLPGIEPSVKAELLTRVMVAHAGKFRGAFVVLNPNAIRIRKDL
jgi:predicted nuclease of predicted toxin-antitoxin system